MNPHAEIQYLLVYIILASVIMITAYKIRKSLFAKPEGKPEGKTDDESGSSCSSGCAGCAIKGSCAPNTKFTGK